MALVLVAGFHAVPVWIMRLLPARSLYENLGPNGYGTLWDGLSMAMPLLLCLGAPIRSGLTLGMWRGRLPRILGVCLLPMILTAAIYPFTSQPFTDDRIGGWLLSPPAQDLLFSGYLYGLLHAAFVGQSDRPRHINRAVFLTAAFFSLCHVPNFVGIAPGYVAFQLVYTFAFGAWILLARTLTGSILPVVATHMIANFIAWKGW